MEPSALSWLLKLPFRPFVAGWHWLRHPAVPTRTLRVVGLPEGPSRCNTWSQSNVGVTLHAQFSVTNTSAHQIKIVHAILRKPHATGQVLVKYWGADNEPPGDHALIPHRATTADIYLHLREGSRFHDSDFLGDVGLVDQYGNTHWTNNVRFHAPVTKSQR